jgi:hypothetical protein
MKLYNLFEQVILEEIDKHKKIISEGVSQNEIDMAINGDEIGRRFFVSFDYTNEKNETGNRWVQIYDYVITTRGNKAISAYQVSGNGNENENGWKIFLLDNISNFKPSKVPFYRPISDTNPEIRYTDKNGVVRNNFNKIGNATKTLRGGDEGIAAINKAKFAYKFGKPTVKKHAQQAADYEASLREPTITKPITKRIIKPITAPPPPPVQQAKPIVRSVTPIKPAKPIVKTMTNGIINKPEIEPEEIGSEEEEENLNVR